MDNVFDKGYFAELGEIVTNIFSALFRGDVSVSDVRDCLNLIANSDEKSFDDIQKPRQVKTLSDFEFPISSRVDYYEYIKSSEWKRKADAAKRAVGYRCQVCNRHKDEVTLNAHHRTYARLGHERPEDITVLCEDCHSLYEHNKR